MTEIDVTQLKELLERRLAVIADLEWRDRDGAGQLAALQSVGEALTVWVSAHRAVVPPRLHHYLQQCSYSKALAWLEGVEEPG